jgi:hypothetical protein
MSFLPDNYTLPESSNGYMKFKQGDNVFRILSSAVVGEEAWTKENQPVRWKPGAKMPDGDYKDMPKAFWAFVVWNYASKAIEILEVTQRGVMSFINQQINNPKWGDPKEYDFVVNKKGEGMSTKYTISTNPKEAIPADVLKKVTDKKINLECLFEGTDPFADGKPKKAAAVEGEEPLSIEDIPF